jgi:hypothetical protein
LRPSPPGPGEPMTDRAVVVLMVLSFLAAVTALAELWLR